ncbi:MAG: hypothetical protein ACYC8T_08280 [Myxococcaceae bacterium]
MTDTGSFNTATVRRLTHDLGPWLIFALVTLALGSTALVLGLRLRTANERAAAEYLIRADAEHQRAAADQAALAAQGRTAALETQLKQATAERDGLRAKVKELQAANRKAQAAKVAKKKRSRRRR